MPLTYRLDNPQACTFQKRMASSQKDMDPQGRESAVPLPARRRNGTLGLRKTALESRMHVQTVGLNVEKRISALSQGELFLLTFPLQELDRLCASQVPRSLEFLGPATAPKAQSTAFIGSLRAACRLSASIVNQPSWQSQPPTCGPGFLLHKQPTTPSFTRCPISPFTTDSFLRRKRGCRPKWFPQPTGFWRCTPSNSRI